MWCRRAGEPADGGGGESVDRGGASGFAAQLRVPTAAVKNSTESAPVGVWCSRAGESADGGGGFGFVDRGGISGCFAADELVSLPTAAAVENPSTEAASVRAWCSRAGESAGDGDGGCVDRGGVSECVVQSSWPVCRRVRRRWIGRQGRRQWMWCSRAGECADGGVSGFVDRGGVSGCVVQSSLCR